MRHPNVAFLFELAFLGWPFLLIAIKAGYPRTNWVWLWLSVPFASWITTNAMVTLDYPVNGGGGGFGLWLSWIVGWSYMIPIFGALALCLVILEFVRKTIQTSK